MQGRYEFLAQDRIIYGFPAAQAVAETADAQGAQRVFLVTSPTLSRKTDEIRKIRDVLGPRCGGTPIDTVKTLLICLAEGAQTEDELGECRIRVRDDGSRVVPKVGRPPVRRPEDIIDILNMAW